ncbi:MAG: hypothetical protein KKF54_02950 [Candidatus Omnitrophica bacterium]|nr:hypothetical protein [Candidatus Omnitrophota bacterium]
MEETNRDSVTIDSLPANFNEEWVHISDAAALLGYRSERQVWYLTKTHGWEKRQALRKGKWVTFIKREDVMRFYGKREERRKLRELSDKRPMNSEVESIMSKEISRLSSEEISKSFPVVLGEYKKMLTDFRNDQNQLVKKATKWKMNFFWLGAVTIVICGFLGYTAFSVKQILSVKEQVIAEKNNDVKVLSVKISDLSTELADTFNKLGGTQKHLSTAQIELSEMRSRLDEAERTIMVKNEQNDLLKKIPEEQLSPFKKTSINEN